jgi:hypothetical protein
MFVCYLASDIFILFKPAASFKFNITGFSIYLALMDQSSAATRNL